MSPSKHSSWSGRAARSPAAPEEVDGRVRAHQRRLALQILVGEVLGPQAVLARLPQQRLATVAEVAYAVELFARREASALTGQTLYLGGV